MKKQVIITLLGFAALKLFTGQLQSRDTRPGNYTVQDISGPSDSTPTIKLSPAKFSCDGRQYCSEMHSRQEAEFFLKNCPNTKMDGDRDGIPCENDSRF